MQPLGVMRYIPVASPSYIKRYLPDGSPHRGGQSPLTGVEPGRGTSGHAGAQGVSSSRPLAGGPRRQQLEGLCGRRGGRGGVPGERQSPLGDHVDAFVGKLEFADDLAVKVFDTGTVVSDVVCAPPLTEIIRTGGQFADEVVQLLVERIASRLGVQGGTVLVTR